MNVVVLQGTLNREPQERVLPAGGHVVEYEVRVISEDGHAETVPVVWHEAPSSAASLGAGAEVVVVGRVRRRFFRASGATQSRTEVVAEAVFPKRSRRRIGSTVDRILREVQTLLPA